MWRLPSVVSAVQLKLKHFERNPQKCLLKVFDATFAVHVAGVGQCAVVAAGKKPINQSNLASQPHSVCGCRQNLLFYCKLLPNCIFFPLPLFINNVNGIHLRVPGQDTSPCLFRSKGPLCVLNDRLEKTPGIPTKKLSSEALPSEVRNVWVLHLGSSIHLCLLFLM